MTQQRGPWRAGRHPPADGKRRRTRLAALLAAGAVAALVVVLLIRFPGALAAREDRASLVYGLVLLVGVGASLVVRQRVRPGAVLRHALAWAGVALLLVLGYSARHDLARLGGRVVGELVPFAPVRTAEGAVTVRMARDGHYYLEARADGVLIRFLVDTGASQVILSPADARRLGLAPEPAAFTQRLRTANGVVRAAPVEIAELQAGGVVVRRVRAAVNQAALAHSLLGMSFLERLQGYESATAR